MNYTSSFNNFFMLNMVFDYFSLTVVVLGLPGNLLMFVVFSRKSLIKLSVSVYFRVMAFTNLYICIAWFMQILEYKLDIEWDLLSWFLCKTSNFGCYLASSMSSWLFVTAILDRYVVITQPARLIFILKPRIPWIVVAFLFLYNFGFYLYIYIDSNLHVIIDNSTNFTRCDWPSEMLYSLLDLINSVVLPLLIMIVATAATFFAVFNSRRRLDAFQHTNSLSSHSNQKQTRSRDIKFGVTMSILNLVFIFLNSPDSILNALSQYQLLNMDPFIYSLAYKICSYLFYLLCAITFYLQVAVNVLVRKEFYSLFNLFLNLSSRHK